MKFTHTFIDRPILAVVVSVFIVMIGLAALVSLPVAQYPNIVPPTIQVTTIYPGASADVVAKTVATPLEQQINGVENMLYMASQSTGDGKLTITVTFRIGTDLNTAQVLTQNRVTTALARLPDDVQHQGVDVRKSTPNILLIVHLISPNGTRNQSYLSNYATLHIRDVLARLPGVGDVQVASPRDYAMRIWIDPDKAAAYDLAAGDIVAALRAQNVQVSAGILNQPPTPGPGAFQLNIATLGRLSTPAEFGTIIIKNDGQGHITRVRDVARVEIGAADYGTAAYLDTSRATPIFVYALPGANSLSVEKAVLSETKSLSRGFPQDVAYQVIYDPTEFIQQSVNEVMKTIGIAILLVVVVVVVFLQSWQASLIPVIAIPVSLIGTMAILALVGFSLNNLSLFGVVLAVGIVVDDAIVVVENVERNIRAGMTPKDAAHKTMDEVGGAIVAIALTLCAVFLPAAFLPGISGLFFQQFAVTIAASTAISCVVSLTMSPALSALLFHAALKSPPRRRVLPIRIVGVFFAGFNRVFDRLAHGYARMTAGFVRRLGLMVMLYAVLIGLTGYQFARAPTGFIPEQDQSYLITVLQLPAGATLARTEGVVRQVADIVQHTPGVSHAVPFVALDATTFTEASNSATVFSKLAPFEERARLGLTAPRVLASLRARLAGIQSAAVFSIAPPPVQGIGNAGGFKMMIEDRANRGPEALERAAQAVATAANKDPALAGVFTLFNTRAPSVYADIDRERAEKLGVTPHDVFEAMQTYLGSTYINDFNYLGRTYQVIAQADGAFRQRLADIGRLRMRNTAGQMVPIDTVARLRGITSPYRVPHYNLYPAAEVLGGAAPSVASGTALAHMEQIAASVLPSGFGFEWTELAYQEQQRGTPTLAVFAAAALFVFLVLAGQYESLSLPLAVILILPMCLLAAVTGLQLRGVPINILAQIGFVVLVGLAAKNAILIVEFARQAETEGAEAADAAIYAACTRLRPILMTSFAFILGVVPLAIATGAGAEMRQSLGIAVFFGMLGVTGFGLLFTPSFYTVVRRISARRGALVAQPSADRP
ncbi:efflux RND transporter permease subunit [Acidisphaera sp. S103]|uniref:efflux RND transporter permease subunit n=1 Tax=Acidisphaera sp. S103 TaxID=1747223 RepID=UPI00131D1539|nr:multidrug efflux RND transporter permease subunit [Acidisphaera sp. S103]